MEKEEGQFRRALKNASIWSLTAAVPSYSVFCALCTNSLTYLLHSTAFHDSCG